jgi:hypothetical protein
MAQVTSYVCDRGPCSYRWDGATGDFTGGRNRPLCPQCKEGYGRVEPRGVRSVVVKMASHEYQSNTDMDKIASDILLADDYDPAYPLVVSVYEHAGWWLEYALVEGKVRVVGSANDGAKWSGPVVDFKMRIRYQAYLREECKTIDRPDLVKCDSEPADATVYTCQSMKCPVHGARNIDMAR